METSVNISLDQLEEEATASVRDYWQLLKPRVMSLVIFTSMAGLWMAPGSIHPIVGLAAILCIAMGAGAAGCLNMWYERDIDSKMARTKHRPTASGIIDPSTALAFGITLSLLSVLLMQVMVNTTAAILLSLTIGFYVGIYTVLLKPSTPQNIVIGGAAGALPPVIGWAAVSPLGIRPWSLFLIIFLWTPPHFWALAMNYMADYQEAELPMMPNTSGVKRTKILIVLYSVLTVMSALVPFYLGMAGNFYLGIVSVFGIGFIYVSFKLLKSEELREGMRVFAFSILYLFLIFASLMVDKKILGN